MSTAGLTTAFTLLDTVRVDVVAALAASLIVQLSEWPGHCGRAVLVTCWRMAKRVRSKVSTAQPDDARFVKGSMSFA